MNNMSMIEQFVRANTKSKLNNYVIPGLESLKATGVTVRMFDMTREQVSCIAPHSHRFDFVCMVLEGSVQNVIWKLQPRHMGSEEGDLFVIKDNVYLGEPGSYKSSTRPSPSRFVPVKKRYMAGECYSMKAEEIHSIFFEDNAKVLFLEGEAITDRNVVLVPYGYGQEQPIDETKPWMFQPAVTN